MKQSPFYKKGGVFCIYGEKGVKKCKNVAKKYDFTACNLDKIHEKVYYNIMGGERLA